MNYPEKMLLYIDGVITGRPSTKKPSEIGARLAELRREAGLSQAQLARLLGMPQRTLSYYERESPDLPARLVAGISRVLGVPVAQLVKVDDGTRSKRGPKSKLERQLDSVRQLPRGQQQFVSKILDSVLQKAVS